MSHGHCLFLCVQGYVTVLSKVFNIAFIVAISFICSFIHLLISLLIW